MKFQIDDRDDFFRVQLKTVGKTKEDKMIETIEAFATVFVLYPHILDNVKLAIEILSEEGSDAYQAIQDKAKFILDEIQTRKQ